MLPHLVGNILGVAPGHSQRLRGRSGVGFIPLFLKIEHPQELGIHYYESPGCFAGKRPNEDLLERLFLEERRRTKIIPHAFGERPVLKLMYAAVIRAAERWRGIAVGEFEQRQLRAIRDELSRAHAERIAPAVTAKATLPIRKLRAER